MTMRGVAGDACRSGATGAVDTSFRAAAPTSDPLEPAEQPPPEMAASTSNRTSKRFNLSILLSYTPVGGHHRLSAGAGPRESGARTWPACRGDRRADSGAE